MPTASAKPPNDITLIGWPSAEETAIANKQASGIDALTISVLRQLPRNTRTIKAVRKAAVIASCTTSRIDARTSTDWSKIGVRVSALGSPALIFGSAAFTWPTIVSVEEAPRLITPSNADAFPLSRTYLVCEKRQ